MSDFIYLDNAATSHPKPEAVYLAVEEALRQGASPGRGGHRQALSAERLVLETREVLCDFFNGEDSAQFVFTGNATVAINQALFGVLRPGDRVVTTSLEHNAVGRPLRALQERGVEVVKVPAPAHGITAGSDLKAACQQSPTRMLVMNHCSNVFGALQPVEELGPWCRDQGILFMVDGSQSAGCLPIDFQALAVDLFAAPGHKGLLGPQGTGFLYVRKGLQLTPLIYGGTGGSSHSDLPPEHFPERLECGTLNTPGLHGLKAALMFLQQVGINQIRAHELSAIGQLLEGLRAIAGVQLYGPEAALQRGAAISFNIAGLDPAEVGFHLDQQHRICLRVGLHCAPDAHRTIGTFPRGTVRVSPGISPMSRRLKSSSAPSPTLRARCSAADWCRSERNAIMSSMKRLLLSLLAACLITACSLPPEQPVTRKMLQASGAYRQFQIEESPEEVLNALNAEGEVVLKAQQGPRPVFVKILATADGLQVTSYDR